MGAAPTKPVRTYVMMADRKAGETGEDGMGSVQDGYVVQIVRCWNESEIAGLYRAGGWWNEGDRPEDIRNLIEGSFAFAVAVHTGTGRAVGMGRVISDGVSDGYIQDLVVLPQYRGSGIGTRLVTELVSRCLEAGIAWIGLIAEPDTAEFYQPLGFRIMDGHIPLIYRGGS
jgi:ribosomal protein S18 acetylase RimI-like enzyme